MSAVKGGGMPLALGGNSYSLLFSLNVMDDMQDKFGGFDKLEEIMAGPHSIKNLRWLLTELINEGLAAEGGDGAGKMTERQVGRMIHAGNIADVKTAVLKAFTYGMTGQVTTNNEQLTTEGDGGDDENPTTERGETGPPTSPACSTSG